MNRRTLALTTLCVSLLAPSLGAQGTSRIEHTIRSAHPEEERQFTVQLPPSYQSHPEHRYPVLYLLDGENNLDYTEAVATFLAQNALVPELIVVALQAGVTRTRDYLPPNATPGAPSGQADQFLAYLIQELVPFVTEHYRAAPLRILSGHSFGGLLVTYAMVEHPGTFQAYLTQSPYLDHAIGGPLLERATEVLATPPTARTFYYMNIGEEPDLDQGFSRMEMILQGATSDSLVWFAGREVGKTHMTTRLVGQYDGLARFFAKDWPQSREELMKGGFAGLQSHIDALSAKYGYPVLYNEQLFQQATQSFLSRQDVTSATASAQLYARQYPQSPVAHFLRGVALASGGKRAEAAVAMDTAVRLYEADPQPRLKAMYENMKQMQQRLGGT